MPDIIITPSSGIIDFYPGSTRVGRIEGSGNTINVTNPSGYVILSSSGLSINTSSPNATFHAYSATSGATIFNVEGTNGSLFSVTDNLSGSLMSVNNNAGLPVFEVFSDDRVVGGRFGQSDLIITSSGNVGIGNSSPSTKLAVSGSVGISGLLTSTSGNFLSSLQLNGTGVSISGHSHTISDISNFGSGVSGLLSSSLIYSTGSSYGNGKILIGSGTSLVSNNITSGTGIVIINGSGTITINTADNYAPINSPSFSGTPTVPTASSGTNTQQIASTAFVRTEISNLNQLSIINPVTGIGSSGYLSKWISNSGVSAGLIYDNGTNIGIGTTTPSGRLHVIGNAIFTSGITVGDSSNNSYIYAPINPATNNIRFNYGGGDRIDFTASQLFYVGTSFFQGNNYVTRVSETSGTLSQRDSYQLVFQNALWDGAASQYSVSTIKSVASTSQNLISRLAFFTHNSSSNTQVERMCITSSGGYVGINTTTPSGHLDVAGDVYVRGTGNNLGTVYFKSQVVGDKALYVGATNGGDLVMNGNGPNMQLSSQGGYLNIFGSSTQIHIGHTYNASNATQTIRFLPAATEMMRMTTSGTLGIGLPTSSASYGGNTVQLFTGQPYSNTRVHIAGSGADSGSAALIVTNSGISPLLFVRNDGNIGIGTNAPSGQLHVIGTGIFDNVAIGTTGTTVGATSYKLLVDGDISIGSGNINRSLTIYGNHVSAKRTILKNVNGDSFLSFAIGSQNLSLGETGGTRFNNINYYAGSSSAGLHRFFVSNDTTPEVVIGSGSVGIGTTTPTSTLQVSGLITSNSGNFTNSLNVNGTGVSISGHTHDASSIVGGTLSSNILPSFSSGKVAYVSKRSSATDTRTSLSPYDILKPFSTISAAASSTSEGDVIIIEPGSYDAFSVSSSGLFTGNRSFICRPGVSLSIGLCNFNGSNKSLSILGFPSIFIDNLSVYADGICVLNNYSTLTLELGDMCCSWEGSHAMNISAGAVFMHWKGVVSVDGDSSLIKINTGVGSIKYEGFFNCHSLGEIHSNIGPGSFGILPISMVGFFGAHTNGAWTKTGNDPGFLITTSGAGGINLDIQGSLVSELYCEDNGLGINISSTNTFIEAIYHNKGSVNLSNIQSNSIVSIGSGLNVNSSKIDYLLSSNNYIPFGAPAPSGNVILGPDVIINNIDPLIGITQLQSTSDNTIKSYAIQRSNHTGTQTSSTISNFNTSVSGLLPVKNISNGSYVSVSSTTGNYTISVTGLQPSGNYSLVGHTHISSNITDFNSSVSGLLPTGTANYITKFGAGGSGLSNSLVFDNGTNIGIGTGIPTSKLHVAGDIFATGSFIGQNITSPNYNGNYISLSDNVVVNSYLGANITLTDNIGITCGGSISLTCDSSSYIGLNGVVDVVGSVGSDPGILNIYQNDSTDAPAQINLKGQSALDRLSLSVNDEESLASITCTSPNFNISNTNNTINISSNTINLNGSVSINSTPLSTSQLINIINGGNLYLWSNFR